MAIVRRKITNSLSGKLKKSVAILEPNFKEKKQTAPIYYEVYNSSAATDTTNIKRIKAGNVGYVPKKKYYAEIATAVANIGISINDGPTVTFTEFPMTSQKLNMHNTEMTVSNDGVEGMRQAFNFIRAICAHPWSKMAQNFGKIIGNAKNGEVLLSQLNQYFQGTKAYNKANYESWLQVTLWAGRNLSPWVGDYYIYNSISKGAKATKEDLTPIATLKISYKKSLNDYDANFSMSGKEPQLLKMSSNKICDNEGDIELFPTWTNLQIKKKYQTVGVMGGKIGGSKVYAIPLDLTPTKPKKKDNWRKDIAEEQITASYVSSLSSLGSNFIMILIMAIDSRRGAREEKRGLDKERKAKAKEFKEKSEKMKAIKEKEIKELKETHEQKIRDTMKSYEHRLGILSEVVGGRSDNLEAANKAFADAMTDLEYKRFSEVESRFTTIDIYFALVERDEKENLKDYQKEINNTKRLQKETKEASKAKTEVEKELKEMEQKNEHDVTDQDTGGSTEVRDDPHSEPHSEPHGVR